MYEVAGGILLSLLVRGIFNAGFGYFSDGKYFCGVITLIIAFGITFCILAAANGHVN